MLNLVATIMSRDITGCGMELIFNTPVHPVNIKDVKHTLLLQSWAVDGQASFKVLLSDGKLYLTSESLLSVDEMIMAMAWVRKAEAMIIAEIIKKDEEVRTERRKGTARH